MEGAHNNNVDNHFPLQPVSSGGVTTAPCMNDVAPLVARDDELDLRQVLRLLEGVVSTVQNGMGTIGAMKKQLDDLQKATKEMHDSLKLMEFVMCTSENDNILKATTNPVNTVSLMSPATGVGGDGEGLNVTNGSKKRKASHADDEDEVMNVDMELSDGEDDGCGDLNKMTETRNISSYAPLLQARPEIPSSWTTSTYLTSSKEKLLSSAATTNAFKRPAPQGEISEMSKEKIASISKRLFQTPSPSQHMMKTPVVAKGGSVKGKTIANEYRPCINKSSGNLLPKGMRCKFRPTHDMFLLSSELEVCAYIFQANNEGEPLMRVGNMVATRGDLECLIPGRPIRDMIFELIALKFAVIQTPLTSQAIWVLPPSFAEDVLMGRSIHDMVVTYCKLWMQPFPTLKFIYIPISTDRGHWYLMVISITDEVVYHIDSHLQVADIEPRRRTISKMCGVLTELISSDNYPPNFLGGAVDFNQWDILEARGIPNCGRSDNSAVWVLDWLAMEDAFQPNLHGELNEPKVRMMVALSIVLGDHNDMRRTILEKASSYWSKFTKCA